MKSSTQGLEEIWEDEVIAKGEREKKGGVFSKEWRWHGCGCFSGTFLSSVSFKYRAFPKHLALVSHSVWC